jgi:hypothetical protein
MQQLVTSVRSAGARQPIMLGGLQWANDLSGWLAWRPRDPLRQLVAAFHLYNFNACADAACWDRVLKPIAAKVPVVTGELGENDCAHGFIDGYMPWADAAGISYLGWTWNTWDCRSGPALISGYDGTPTAFGEGFRAHLASAHRRTSSTRATFFPALSTGPKNVTCAYVAPKRCTGSARRVPSLYTTTAPTTRRSKVYVHTEYRFAR